VKVVALQNFSWDSKVATNCHGRKKPRDLVITHTSTYLSHGIWHFVLRNVSSSARHWSAFSRGRVTLHYYVMQGWSCVSWMIRSSYVGREFMSYDCAENHHLAQDYINLCFNITGYQGNLFSKKSSCSLPRELFKTL